MAFVRSLEAAPHLEFLSLCQCTKVNLSRWPERLSSITTLDEILSPTNSYPIEVSTDDSHRVTNNMRMVATFKIKASYFFTSWVLCNLWEYYNTHSSNSITTWYFKKFPSYDIATPEFLLDHTRLYSKQIIPRPMTCSHLFSHFSSIKYTQVVLWLVRFRVGSDNATNLWLLRLCKKEIIQPLKALSYFAVNTSVSLTCYYIEAIVAEQASELC